MRTLLGFCFVAGAALAAPGDIATTGTFEGGFGYGSGGARGVQTAVDQLVLRHKLTVSEALTIEVENGFSVTSATSAALDETSGYNFFSKYALQSGPPNTGGLVVSNLRAVAAWKPSKNFVLAVGNQRVPFGIEGTYERFRLPSFYYSPGYQRAQQFGWHFDIGAALTWDAGALGTLEVALVDGREVGVGTDTAPAGAVRYRREFSKGEALKFTPMLSAYAGRFDGGPQDLGLGGGFQVRVGSMWLDAEALYVRRDTAAGRNALFSAAIEPGVDLGFGEFALKYAFSRDEALAGTPTAHQIAFMAGKYLGNDVRLRFLYRHAGIGGAAQTDEARLLLGAAF